VVWPVALSYAAPLLQLRWRSALFDSGRYILAVLLLYLMVAMLYRWLPSRHLPRREVLPGAAVTVALWILLASLFSLYLQNLTRFTVTYGSLGGIIIALFFFYMSGLIFIFGAEINSARRRTEAALLREEHARRHEAAAG
jgi:YihY family inner membrane protein